MSEITPPRDAIPQPRPAQSAKDPALWKAAQSIEASFLAEMLKSAGLGEASGEFGGGPGEIQFSSLMVEAQSDAIVTAGGLGLAESIYRSLIKSGSVR